MIFPETHPDHEWVGHRYRGIDCYSIGWRTIEWVCIAYDPDIGYWMQAVDGSRMTNVSERAIDRTWHKIYEDDYGDFVLEHTVGGYRKRIPKEVS
jgi:hypothetical protein